MAIEGGTGLPSSDKISSLVSEVMTRVVGSQDKLATFVPILECRNKELAETLRSAHQGPASSQTLLLHITNTVWDMKETKLNHLLQGGKRKETHLLISMWPSFYRAPPPTWDPLPQCKHIRLAMIKGRERDLPTITLKKWAKDELKAFGAVAFVHLHDLCVCEDDTRPQHTLSSLLFLASGGEMEMHAKRNVSPCYQSEISTCS